MPSLARSLYKLIYKTDNFHPIIPFLRKYCSLLASRTLPPSQGRILPKLSHPNFKIIRTLVLTTARVFWDPTNPTFVTFSIVLNSEKLHSESKYEENFDKIDNFDFLFLMKGYSLSAYAKNS